MTSFRGFTKRFCHYLSTLRPVFRPQNFLTSLLDLIKNNNYLHLLKSNRENFKLCLHLSKPFKKLKFNFKKSILTYIFYFHYCVIYYICFFVQNYYKTIKFVRSNNLSESLKGCALLLPPFEFSTRPCEPEASRTDLDASLCLVPLFNTNKYRTHFVDTTSLPARNEILPKQNWIYQTNHISMQIETVWGTNLTQRSYQRNWKPATNLVSLV